jgi:hypothetical protein
MVQPQPSGGFEWTQEPWGAALRNRPLLSVADHLFTVANLQLRDDPREWDQVASAMGGAEIRLVRQVHRAEVAVARLGHTGTWAPPEADVIVSDDPATAIGIRVADCAPILIADERLGVVAGAHAGWRGTVAGAAGAAVRALTAEFGSRPADLIAVIGPCLGPCCGEVGTEVVETFRGAGHGEAALARWFAPGPNGHPHLDLWRANSDQLSAAGVPPERVYVAELCTKTYPHLLHSYRASGPGGGRMVAAIRARGSSANP